MEVSHGSRSSPGAGKQAMEGWRVEVEPRKQAREEDGFAKRSQLSASVGRVVAKPCNAVKRACGSGADLAGRCNAS